MEKPKGVEIGATEKKVVMALLVHPRLANLRRQFRDELVGVLADSTAIERVAATSEMPSEELRTKGKQLVEHLGNDAAYDDQALAEFADIALAFCLSSSFLTFWGHFTATLQKLMRDDSLIGDVAGCCGVRGTDQVRVAIRQFSDSRRMPTGRAGR